MNSNRCYVFGAGERYGAPPIISSGDWVIAADGGYEFALSCYIQPNLLIGDFDSLTERPKGIETISLPCKKDDTDLLAALRVGWERGFRTFHILGGMGGRIDHTVANIQCLAWIARLGGQAFLYDRDVVLTIIYNGCYDLGEHATGVISVFAFGNIAEGVTIHGLDYEVTEQTLTNSYPLGISNEFIGKHAMVSVKRGALLLIFPQSCLQDEVPPRENV
ncbi:MAG: thiamine diphosphokinase [Lachnospiraceae bacterium]|nr:thiamine diphosphokinase [Lachnospiraceae bacterium]